MIKFGLVVLSLVFFCAAADAQTQGEPFGELQDQVDDLQSQIDAIQPVPGPPGPPGSSCTVIDNGDSKVTLSCTDGSSVTFNTPTELIYKTDFQGCLARHDADVQIDYQIDSNPVKNLIWGCADFGDFGDVQTEMFFGFETTKACFTRKAFDVSAGMCAAPLPPPPASPVLEARIAAFNVVSSEVNGSLGFTQTASVENTGNVTAFRLRVNVEGIRVRDGSPMGGGFTFNHLAVGETSTTTSSRFTSSNQSGDTIDFDVTLTNVFGNTLDAFSTSLVLQ